MSAGSGSAVRSTTRTVWKKLTPAGKSYYPFKDFKILNDRRLLVVKRLTSTLRNGAVGLDEAIGGGTVMPNAAQTSQHLHLRTCQELKPASVVWILEGVPTRHNPNAFAAWRVFCFFSDMKFKPGKIVDKVIETNRERRLESTSEYHQTKRNISPDAERYRHHDIYSRDDYLQMCSRINVGANYSDEASCFDKQLHDRTNPANPFYVWDLYNALADIPDADPEYCKRSNYYDQKDGKRMFKFPNPNNCWRLTPDQASLASYTTFYSPVTRVPVAETDMDVMLYRRLQTCTIPAAGHDEEDDVFMSPMMVKVLAKDDPFPYLVGQRADQDVAITPERLARLNKERRDDIRRKELLICSRVDLPEEEKYYLCSRLYREFEALAVPEIASVWNEFADISLEHKVTVKWGDEYLYRHKNFCGSQPKITSNLPLRAEAQVRMSSDAELVYEIHTAHAAFRASYMSQLSAFDPDRDDKIHYLGLGPPGKSKSFILDRAAEVAIPKSVTVVSYRSAKCDTGVKNMDGAILQFHEFPNDHMVEVKGVVSEACNLFKDRSVRGMFSADVLANDPVTGKRVKDPIEVKSNTAYLGNTNTAEHLISPAINDRFYKFRFTDQIRADKSIHDTMASRDHNPYISDMRKKKNENYHRTQFLFAKACRKIELSVLPRVNTAFARWIVSQTLKRAEEDGMPPASSRTSKRIIKFATIQTILNAIYVVFDSDMCPIRDEPHRDEHFLLLAPFLYTSYPETALALGLMKASELDNKLHRDLIAAMILAFFPAEDPDAVSTAGGSSSAPPPEPMSTTARLEKMTVEQRIALLSKYHPDTEQKDKKDRDWLSAPNVFNRVSHKMLKTSGKKGEEDKSAAAAAAAAAAEEKQRQHEPGNDAKQHIEDAEAMRKELDDAKSRQTMKEYQKYKLIAGRLQARMNPRPEEDIVIGALRQMERTPVKSIDKSRHTVKMFEFHEDGFRLATSAAVWMAHDVLEKALVDVLQFAKIRKGDIAFEEMTDERAFLFRCLHVDPGRVSTFKEVENPDFVDSRKMDFIQSQFVDADGKPTVDMSLAFQSGRTTTIDADMEEVFFARHISNIKWTQEELDKYGFGNAYFMTERAKELAEKRLAAQGKKPLPHYPDGCFVPRGSQELVQEAEEDRKKRPARYSAKQELEQLNAARRRPNKIARIENAADVAHNRGEGGEGEDAHEEGGGFGGGSGGGRKRKRS